MTLSYAHARARAIAGTSGSFVSDVHAAWDVLGVPAGQFMERAVASSGLLAGAAFNALLAVGPVPSTVGLDLPFAETKTLPTGVSFSRAGAGAFINSSGFVEFAASGTPRFTHKPITLTSLGLIAEESRTNLLTYSNTFSNAAWIKGETTVQSNSVTSPANDSTASKLVASTTPSAYHYITQAAGKAASAIAYTGSVYLKAGGYNAELLLLNGPSSQGYTVRINCTTGVVESGPSIIGTLFTTPSVDVEPMGNGWFRASLTATSDTDTAIKFQVTLHNGTSSTFTGDGTSGVFLWEMQLEAGTQSTSTIHTDAAQATRSADMVDITGTNFSSWFNPLEGTFVVTAVPAKDSSASLFPRTLELTNGTLNEVIRMYARTIDDSYGVDCYSGGVNNVAFLAVGSVTYGTLKSVAFAYKLNDFAVSFAGGAIQTDTSGAVPLVDRVHIAGGLGGGSQLNGPIARVTYYPSRLTNIQIPPIAN